MAVKRQVPIVRSDVVGSLVRPVYLLEARRAVRAGTLTKDSLREVEDRAVLEAIALQEEVGLDVITDGEFRRSTWIATLPMLRPEPEYQEPLAGTSLVPVGPGWWSLWRDDDGRRVEAPAVTERSIITEPLRVVRDIATDEYAFLKAHARARTKYTIPAPSWHRIFWNAQYSRDAYPTAEDFLRAVRDYLREEVVARLIALGCDYIQLDAPNYAQWHVDAENREIFTSWGHDMAAELVADAEIDNSVFDGIDGVTRAIHICRGNGGRRWFASGGYDAIAAQVFRRLTNTDRLLVEYDTPRAGGSRRCATSCPSTRSCSAS